MASGDRVIYSKSSGRMRVNYIGETRDAKLTKGDDIVKLENSKEYECMEKEFHSGLFVRITVGPKQFVKVKRSELQKV